MTGIDITTNVPTAGGEGPLLVGSVETGETPSTSGPGAFEGVLAARTGESGPSGGASDPVSNADSAATQSRPVGKDADGDSPDTGGTVPTNTAEAEAEPESKPDIGPRLDGATKLAENVGVSVRSADGPSEGAGILPSAVASQDTLVVGAPNVDARQVETVTNTGSTTATHSKVTPAVTPGTTAPRPEGEPVVVGDQRSTSRAPVSTPSSASTPSLASTPRSPTPVGDVGAVPDPKILDRSAAETPNEPGHLVARSETPFSSQAQVSESTPSHASGSDGSQVTADNARSPDRQTATCPRHQWRSANHRTARRVPSPTHSSLKERPVGPVRSVQPLRPLPS